MATIQFDDSKFHLRSRRISGEPEVPTVIKFLVSKGIVKNENQAIGIMLCIIGLLIIFSIMVTRSSGARPATLDEEYAQKQSVLV